MFQACEYHTLDLAISQAHDSLVHACGEEPSTASHWAFLQYQALSELMKRSYVPLLDRQEHPLIEEGDNEHRILTEHNLPGKVCEVIFSMGVTEARVKTLGTCEREGLAPSETYLKVVSHPIEDYLKKVRIDAHRFYLVVPEEVRWYGEALGIWYREDFGFKSITERRDLVLPTVEQIRKYAWTNLIRED